MDRAEVPKERNEIKKRLHSYDDFSRADYKGQR